MDVEPIASIDPDLDGRIAIDVHLEDRDPARELAELGRGLATRPRRISSRYFYDERGSRLFEEITRLPEYYLTRAETRLLKDEAPALAERVRARDLVELGSGAATKTPILIDEMIGRGLARYVPFDVDEGMVRRVVLQLAERYPRLRIRGVVGDFTRHLEHIPSGARRLVAFLGSTLGNLDRAGSVRFLAALAARLAPSDRLLLGLDLIKDADVLQAAYDDSAGVTARFNRNILRVVNRILEGDFDPRLYAHRARWNPEENRMEISLVAREAHRVRLGALDLELVIERGEKIGTEISTKYSRSTARELLDDGGFEMTDWRAGDGRFALCLARPAG